MLVTPDARAIWLPPAQLTAASNVMISPSGLALPPAWTRMTPMPAVASASDASWNTRTRSPSSHVASTIVKSTCDCTTKDARPGEI